MAISSRAVRKKKRIRTLYEVLTDAVNYYVNRGWDSEKSLLEWCRKLRVAAQRETPDDTVARKHLTAIYSRLVIDGGALRDQPPDGCIDSREVRKRPGRHWIIRASAGLDLMGLASL